MNLFLNIIFYLFLGFILITAFEVIRFFINRKRSIPESPNTTEIAKKEFIRELNITKKQIWITTGDCNKDFYSITEVKEALEKVPKKVTVRIITGPIEGNKKNPIVKLANKKKNIQLFLNKEGYINPHFRIIDNRHIFIESPHLPKSKNRYYSFFWDSSFLVRKYRNYFISALSKSYRIPSEIDFKEIKKEDDKPNRLAKV